MESNFGTWFQEWWKTADAERRSKEDPEALHEEFEDAMREYGRLHPSPPRPPEEARPLGPSKRFDELKKECERLGVVMGPEAAKGPIARMHPVLQVELLRATRGMMEDVEAGRSDLPRELGKTKELVLRELGGQRDELEGAILEWNAERLNEKDRRTVEHTQRKIRERRGA